MPLNVSAFEPFEAFDKRVREIFQSGHYGPEGMDPTDFDVSISELEEQTESGLQKSLRIKMLSEGKQLRFTVAPGPKYSSGAYGVSLKSEKGSEYARVINPEMYFSKPSPRFSAGDITTRLDPLKSLKDYAVGAFYESLEVERDLQGTFADLLSEGSPLLKLAGGVLTMGPHHEQHSLEAIAGRVTMGFDPSVGLHDQGKIIRNLPKHIKHAALYPEHEDFLRSLVGKLPYVGGDGRLRWRPVSLGGDYGDDSFDFFGGYVKRLNLLYDKEVITETALYKESASGYLEPHHPAPILTGEEAGLRRLNVQMGEDSPRSAWVERNVLSVTATPDSGTTKIYREEMNPGRENIRGPYFGGQKYEQLLPEDYGAMKDIRFEWGIFDKEFQWKEDEEGRRTPVLDEEGGHAFNWARRQKPGRHNVILDVEKGKHVIDAKPEGQPEDDYVPLEGFTLGKGERAVIGLRTHTDKEGKRITKPIEYTADQRSTTFRGIPRLILPPFFDRDTLKFSPVEGEWIDKRSGELLMGERILKQDEEHFRKMAGGANVDFVGGVDPFLAIPIATESGFTVKGMGMKTSFDIPYGIMDMIRKHGEDYIPQATVAGKKRDIGAITGEVKDPLVNFLYGVFGTMNIGTQAELIHRLYGKDSSIFDEIERVREIQGGLKEEHKSGAITDKELSERWRGVSIDKMAELHAKDRGESITPWRFVEDMFTQFMIGARDDPKGFYDAFGFGFQDKPEYVKYKTFHKGYKDYYEHRRDESAVAAHEASKGKDGKAKLSLEKAQKIAEELYRFTDIPDSNQVLMEILYQGQLASRAGPLATEHLSRGNAMLNPQAMAGIAALFPEAYKQMVEQSEALMSPGQRSWRHLADYVRYAESGYEKDGEPLRPGYEGIDYRRVSQTEADRLLGVFMPALELEERDFEGYQKELEEVLGKNLPPFLVMEATGTVFPTPGTVEPSAEYMTDDAGVMEEIGALSYSYGPGLVGALSGQTYDDKEVGKFLGHVSSTLHKGGDLLKKYQQIPTAGIGSHVSAGGYLPPGHMLVSDDNMKSLIIEMAKANELDVFYGGRIDEDFLRQSFKRIEEQGGLFGFFNKQPTYGRTSGNIPTKFVHQSLAKEQYDLPEWVEPTITVEGGKVKNRGLILHGTLGEIGPEGSMASVDYDFDPGFGEVAQKLSISPETGEASLSTVLDKEFMRRWEMSGPSLTKHMNTMLSRFLGTETPGTWDATVNETTQLILERAGVKTGKLETSTLKRVTQTSAIEEGMEYISLKREMGSSYNVRELSESAAVSAGTYDPETIDEITEAMGLSYSKHLEFEMPVPRRAIEQLFGSLFVPASREGGQLQVGLQSLQDYGTKGKSGPGVYAPGSATKFDVNNLALATRIAIGSDVDRKFLTPHAALAYVSRNTEEYKQLKERLKNEEVRDIISSHMDTKGYDFSESLAGRAIALAEVDKLFGYTKVKPKQFSDDYMKKEFAGRNVLGVVEDIVGRIGGEEHYIGDMADVPWVKTGLAVLQSKLGKKPMNILELSAVQEEIDRLHEAGEDIPFALRNIQDRFDTQKAFDIFSEPGVIRKDLIDMSALRDYTPTPSEYAALINPQAPYAQHTIDRIIGKAMFGIHESNIFKQEQKHIAAGREFEKAKESEIAEELNLENVHRFTGRLTGLGSIFGEGFRFEPDIVGVHKETGEFYTVEAKWSAKIEDAKRKLTPEGLVHTQAFGYQDVFYALAHPKENFKNWDQLEEVYGSEEEFFTTYIAGAIDEGEREKTGKGLSADERVELEKKVGSWYEAITGKDKRGGGQKIAVVSGHGGLVQSFAEDESVEGYPKDLEGKRYKIDPSQMKFTRTTDDEFAAIHTFTRELARPTAELVSLGKEGITPKNVVEYARRTLRRAEEEDVEEKLSESQLDLLTKISKADQPRHSLTPESIENAVKQALKEMEKTEEILPITKRATGGRIEKDDPTLVGEKGAEVIIPDKGGQVISNDDIKSIFNNLTKMMGSLNETLLNAEAPRHFPERHEYKSILSAKYKLGGQMAERYQLERMEGGTDLRQEYLKELSDRLRMAGEQPLVEYGLDLDTGETWFKETMGDGGTIGIDDAEKFIPKQIEMLRQASKGQYKEFLQTFKERSAGLADIRKKVAAGFAAGEDPLMAEDISHETMDLMQKIMADPTLEIAEVVNQLTGGKGARPGKTPEALERTISSAVRESERVDFSGLQQKVEEVTDSFGGLKEASEEMTELQVKATDKLSSAIQQFSADYGALGDIIADTQESLSIVKEYQAGRGGYTQEEAAAHAQAAKRNIAKLEGYGKRVEEVEETISGIKSGDPDVIGETKFARGFRQVFGGWGLMYMGRLAQMGIGGMQKGFAETESYELQLQQAARALYGIDYGEGVTPLAYAQQGARLRSGGGIYGALASIGLAGSELSDITSAIGAGVGGALATNYIAPVLGPMLGVSAGKVAAFAGPAGIAAFGIMHQVNQISNMVNYDDTVTRAAAQIGGGSFWGKVGGAMKLPGLAIADVFRPGSNQFNPFTDAPPSYMEVMKYADKVERLNKNQMTFAELKAIKAQGDDEWMKFVQAVGNTSGGALGQVSAMARTSAILNMPESADIDPNAKVLDIMLPAALDMEAGGPSAQVASMIYGLQGAVPLPGDRDLLTGKVAHMGYGVEKVAAGLQFMSQLPNPIAQFGELTEDQLIELAPEYQEIAGGPHAQMFMERATLTEEARRRGWDVPLIPHMYKKDRQWTGEQYHRESENNLRLQRRITLYDQARDAGLSYAEAQAFSFTHSGSTQQFQLGSAKASLAGTFQSMGYAPTDAWDRVNKHTDITSLTVESRWANIEGTFQQMGITPERAQAITGQFEGAAGADFMERVLSFDPQAYGQMYQDFSQHGGDQQFLSHIQPIAQLANYDMITGQPTAHSRYRTSLAGPVSPMGGQFQVPMQQLTRMSAEENAQRIWGSGWQGVRMAQAMVYGANIRTGETYTSHQDPSPDILMGERGLDVQRLYESHELSQRSLGVSYAQLALTERYRPLFWDIEDRQRALSYRQQEHGWRQQEWGFGQQEASLAMQTRHFYEGFALQERQAGMQRGWAREDWGYQDQTRALQWGWKQEDFAENIRFMTGRDRRLGERQMERETIMYNLETGQIDTQRKRQEEMWALEDERFDMQKRHHEEQRQFQLEAIAMQRRFFEEGKEMQLEARALQEEFIKLNREYQTEQLELQKAALGVQQEQLDKQLENNIAMLEYRNEQEDALATAQEIQKLQSEFFDELLKVMKEILDISEEASSNLGSSEFSDYTPSYGPHPPSSGGGGGGGGGHHDFLETGGDFLGGSSVIVGEAGWEVLRPGRIGSVVNRYDIAQAMQQDDKWSSRSVFYPSGGSTGGSAQQPINIYIGNERIAQFIVDAVKKDLEVF
jgi:hypothetical protein